MVLHAQADSGEILALLLGCGFQMIWLVLAIIVIVGLWKIFEKAGRPGWEAIIPIYNSYVLVTQINGRDILWFILMLIPCVNIFAALVASVDLAKSFGKDNGFGILTFLFPFVMFPILGFGKDRYRGPSAKGAGNRIF